MLHHFLKARRILALLLVAALVLVQAKVAFAGCVTADTGVATSISAMDDCQGCSNSTAKGADSYYALSNICGNHCLRSYVPPAQGSEMPATATAASVKVATVLPRISPEIQAAFPGKARLIYRLQRLLI